MNNLFVNVQSKIINLKRLNNKNRINNKPQAATLLAKNDLSFKGYNASDFNEFAYDNRLFEEMLESKNFEYYKNTLKRIKSFGNKEAMQEFKTGIMDIRNTLNEKINQLLPTEKIKNAQYIKKYKIGESQVIIKQTMQPITVEFTKDYCQYFTFIDSIKTGEIVLRPSTMNPTFYAHSMASFDNDIYKGVGTKLHQIGVERSIQEGFGGKVRLDVTDPGAKLFHYKFGFRKVDDENDSFTKLMQSVISGNKPISEIDYKEIKMYLPEEEIQRIIETQIKKSPIITKEIKGGI